MPTIIYIAHRIILSCVLLAYCVLAQAETVKFVRDYTYNASENDSKVTARQAALEQLQRTAIEEVGIQVQASFTNTETFSQGEMEQSVLSNFKTFSQALTKTKILEEKWNGETFYLKAEIEVDPEGITSVMNGLSAVGISPEEQCKLNRDKVLTLLKKPADDIRNQALVDMALASHFDTDCHEWQFYILSALTRNTLYPVKDYQAFLFSELETIPVSDGLVTLMSESLKYTMANNGDLSSSEWEIMTNVMHRIQKPYIARFLRWLSDMKGERYESKISDMIRLAAEGKIGFPEPLSKDDMITMAIKASQREHALFALTLYLNNSEDLSDINALAPILIKRYQMAHDDIGKIESADVNLIELSNEAIYLLLEKNEINSLNHSAQNVLYELLRPLINDRKDKDYQYLKDLLKRYPNKFAELVESRKIHASYKNKFLLKYNLPAVNLCSPEECAKLARDRDLNVSEQNTYLDYLVAYGVRAKSAEKDIIRLFDRAQSMTSSVYRTHRKTALITVLGNIKTVDDKALDLLVLSLEDFDYKVPNVAIDTLSVIGQPAFNLMKARFPDAEDLSKRRMIEAMGKMSLFGGLLDYLKSIPEDDYYQFELEDAIESLEDQV